MTKLLYLIILIIIFYPSPAYCYIDPGTGSILFSGVIGIISILFFALKTLISWIGTLPIFHHKHKMETDSGWNKFVIYSEGGQYWNVFKPIIDEMVNRNQRILYYTSDNQDPGLVYNSEYMKSLFIGKGNRAYARLNMLEADICLMTTPGLDVFQLKRSRGVKHYCHILHSPVDTTLYHLFSFDYFDSMLLTGEFQIKAIRHLENKRGTKQKDLYVVGCTYLDVLNQKLSSLDYKKEKTFTPLEKSADKFGNTPYEVNSGKQSSKPQLRNIPTRPVRSDASNGVIGQSSLTGFSVLVSPSWGSNGILKKSGMALLKPLAESGNNIIIRPHPQSLISEKSVISTLKSNLSKYQNIEWDLSHENLQSMFRSDMMISDFSGIIFDYIFLFSKPVAYTQINFDKRGYDLSDYDDEPWIFEALRQIGTEINEGNLKNVCTIINNISSSQDLFDKIQKAKNTAYSFQGQSGFKSVEALFEIRKKLVN